MKTLQSYLSTLHKRNELTTEESNAMRPKNVKLARAHGLPKIHKEYNNIPKFRPIVDTTGTPHYSAGKFLTNLLNPLAMNEFTLKDSFDAVNKIKNIPSHLFDDRYNYVSFDMESLFTNVPIKRTIDVILKPIYIDKVISTNLKKRSIKKPLLDTCTKTSFTFYGVIYEQKDGVSMGSSLGHLLANVIMTDLEEKVIKPIFRKNTNTGLYNHFSSYVPWTYRTAWIKSLTSRVSHICLPDKLSSEINFFKKLASWTGFPIFFIKRIINQVLNITGESTNNAESPDVLTIYI